jgi:ribonuclease BN (tRNA processing enzyme)
VEIFFIGVGEACDSEHGNTSALVTTQSDTRILLDCGFSVPHHYFQTFADAPEPDYIWISHFHGDHFFGLPLFFLRLWQMKRTRPLPIVGQQGVAEKVREVLELAYPGFENKLSFELRFHVVRPDDTVSIGGLNWSTAVTEHSQYNLGLLLDDGKKRLYYSGDGRPTSSVQQLVRGCDLVIHEAFRLVDQFPYHGSITSCLQLADKAGVKKMALLHLDRDFRKHELEQINKLLKTRPGTLLPVAGDRLTV